MLVIVGSVLIHDDNPADWDQNAGEDQDRLIDILRAKLWPILEEVVLRRRDLDDHSKDMVERDSLAFLRTT